MNVVSLVGNLATDVELKDVGDDMQVATFVLAVDRLGKEEADFFGLDLEQAGRNAVAGTCRRAGRSPWRAG